MNKSSVAYRIPSSKGGDTYLVVGPDWACPCPARSLCWHIGYADFMHECGVAIPGQVIDLDNPPQWFVHQLRSLNKRKAA